MSLRTASVVILAATQLVNAAALPTKRNDFSTAIVGGEPAGQGEFPYIVSFQEEGVGHFCGGSLIDARTVVTAAHCVSGKVPGQFRVQAGSNTLFVGGVTTDVARISIHPNYADGNFDSDIATVVLTGDVGGANIGFVSLPQANEDPAGGTPGVVAGWGNTGPNEGLSNDLNKVGLSIVDRGTCLDAYGGGTITDNMICAGGAGGANTCPGDSGGPYTINGVLQGIVSFGPAGGCDAAVPTGYSRVSTLLDFVNSNRG